MGSKVILVTGASRGIGLAITNYLLAASHKVFLVSRSQKELEGIKTKFPSQVDFLAADLSDLNVCEHHAVEPEPMWQSGRPGLANKKTRSLRKPQLKP